MKNITETHPSLINSKVEVSELSDKLIDDLICKIQKHTRDVVKIREAIEKVINYADPIQCNVEKKLLKELEIE